MKPGWRAVIVFVIVWLAAAMSCEQEVPLGVDPRHDAAPSDAGATD